MAVVFAGAGLQTYTYDPAERISMDQSSVFGFTVIFLVALVFAFFQVKLRSAIPPGTPHASILALAMGDELGPNVVPVFGSTVFGGFALGRFAHAAWNRNPIQLIELAAVAGMVGLICGAKLAEIDARAKQNQ